MFKKICAATVTAALASASVVPGIAADVQKVNLQLISETATSVSVKATNNSGSAKDVILLAVYTDENDKITAINTVDENSRKTIENGADATLTAGIADKSSDSTLKYYVWDGESLRTPLENGAPVPPTQIEAASQTVDSVSLSWSGADDDYNGVTSYNIYNYGMKVGNNVSAEAFTDTKLRRGTDNKYSVKSVDDEGLESVDAKVIDAVTKDFPTVILDGSSKISNGVDYYIDERGWSYGTTMASEADGLLCRATTNRTSDAAVTRHPFLFTSDYASQISSVTNITFVITYFDASELSGKSMTLDYCRTGDEASTMTGGTTICTFGGTNRWKTAVCRIGNANFGSPSTNENNSLAKFRIHSAMAGLKIRSVSVLPTADFNAITKEAVGKVDAAYIDDGLYFNFNNPGVTAKTTVAEKGCVTLAAGQPLECDVLNADVAAASNVVVEVDYYTEYDNDSITLSHGTSTQTANTTAKNEWQRMRFNLTGASFSDGTDFSLSSSGGDINIHSVRVYIP